MTVSKAIQQLQDIKERSGDIPVYIFNPIIDKFKVRSINYSDYPYPNIVIDCGDKIGM